MRSGRGRRVIRDRWGEPVIEPSDEQMCLIHKNRPFIKLEWLWHRLTNFKKKGRHLGTEI